MATMRQYSRLEFEAGNTREDINQGAFQRIADATEKMAANWTALSAERDRYKSWYEERGRQITRLENQIRALRGVVTKAKKKAEDITFDARVKCGLSCKRPSGYPATALRSS